MEQPTNGELLVHILHIKERVEDVHGDTKKLIEQGGNHEGRIMRLEIRPVARPTKFGKSLSMLGGFLGGLVSGFFGHKA